VSSLGTERLRGQAVSWIAGDPDAETRAELEAIVDANDEIALAERMSAPLEFGTAGLRGIVGAGPGRMNRAVVIRTTRALAEYLLAREPDARTRPVVVGWDARLSSERFADDTIGVLAAAGIPVRCFERYASTPLVAYVARSLGASAAVVVTASHNPPEYNGYKLYASNAVQIVSPVDQEIAERIAHMGPAKDIPRVEDPRRAGHVKIEPVPESLITRYVSDLCTHWGGRPADRSIRIVYTPLHGVGAELVERALRESGFDQVHVVAEQAAPDGRFPTVQFPNPEEPGALDRALALADQVQADLVLANDPDADRLAVCVPTPSGRWLQLSGNQVGFLLEARALSEPAPVKPLVVASVVSSPLAREIAEASGARFEETLTGFKWIWNAALELESREAVRFVFGYEEALGYCVGRNVRDKDGIGAALAFAILTAEARAAGQSVLEVLGEIYRRHRLWTSVQRSVVRPGLTGMAEIAAAIQRLAGAPPAAIGGRRVERVLDYRTGAEARPRWLGRTAMVQLDLTGGGRLLARPSGTEPKLKIYVDLPGNVGDESWLRAEEALRAEAARVAGELVAALGLG
jgi:phosphomannomutase